MLVLAAALRLSENLSMKDVVARAPKESMVDTVPDVTKGSRLFNIAMKS